MTSLIILHGWQSSKEKWQEVERELEKAGLRVIVPDLPGFKPETELRRAWDLNDYVGWLCGFVEKSCPELGQGFFLLGHSFGGRLAIKYATQHPEHLKGLVLVSSAGIKEKGLKKSFCRAASRAIKQLRIDKCPLWEPGRRFFYYYILRRKDYVQAPGFLKQTMANVVEEDLAPLLEKITAPTLLIWGSKDKMTPLKHAKLMQEKIPNATLEILEGIGHTPHLKCPKLLATKITQSIL